MNTVTKKKITLSLWSIFYLVVTVGIVISMTSIFNNMYYESVYVSGSSMSPTFVGNGATEHLGSDYGLIDKDAGAKRNVKRFQIVTTYYPGDDPESGYSSYKIKRVLVKPGERFKIEDNNLYIYRKNLNGWGEPLDMPFNRKFDDTLKQYPDTTLGDDEYFLAGDNWTISGSYDSFQLGPIEYDLLVGVVVKMQGRCTVNNGKVVEKEKYKDGDHYYLGVNY